MGSPDPTLTNGECRARMRILLLTTHLNIGGIPVYTISLAKGLSQKGHNVAVASYGGDLVYQLNDIGIQHFSINTNTKSILSYKIWASFFRLKKLFKNFRPDIIHAQTRVTQFLAHLLSGNLKAPYITTCHGLYKPRLERKILGCWGKKTIAISRPVAEHLMKAFSLKKENIEIIHNAVALEKFTKNYTEDEKNNIRSRLGLGNGAVIGSVSRLSEVKGHRFLIEAIKGLQYDYPHIQLLIVGDGPEKENLKKLAQRLGIEKNVFFAGNISSPEEIYPIIDIFVHPAYWQEPFGLSIIEAMAAGKPVIATRVGAVPEIVRENENAILVRPKDADEISNALRQLLASEDLRRRFGENSARIAKEKFSLAVMTDKILKVYEEVVANARY